MTDPYPPAPAAAEAVASGLDALIADGHPGPLGLLSGGSALRMAAALAVRPGAIARRGIGFAAELARIGAGLSRVSPAPDDARYADPAWWHNPLLRRLAQAHLAASATADALVSDAGLGAADEARLRGAVAALSGALSPSTSPLNPAVWRSAVDTGGASAVRGVRRLVADLAVPPRAPVHVAASLEVGADVGATPGAVVLRTPVFELIHYLPQTELVHEVPLLVVPPVLNRFYVADLAPGRSIVEHLVRAGVQVFALSWRNPDPAEVRAHADWDLDTYGRAVLEGMDATEHVARTQCTSLMAFGAGGTITAMLLAHLAATGAQHRVAAVTLAGTVLDTRTVPPDPATARAAVAESERTGHLDGRPLLAELAWRAPDALLWPQAVRSYLCGEEPPTSDVLFWLTDTTRAPAGLHRDLVDVALRAPLSVPGAASMLDTPLDLAKVDRDCYLVAGAADPVTAWRDAYTAAGLFGGSCRFVLATGGHAASLVSPPGGAGTGFRAAGAVPGKPGHWLAAAEEQPGSWWTDHLGWLTARSGRLQDAPPELGGRGMHALAPAPGAYVLER
ncbi:PHA/PHB synthase family protein [Pseudonocardia cypriaca]|uniref:Polyhydroxyalkanoate synthase n=1 Tax=Pseudonocardia cypriaca TaxID=882449 RepID=A0A543FU94_9PSEU|nr:alpha/beta fold hydrolase [Pseudonocardia cypriaca]TQM37402.1 polyhydroxyalkanoate synthase [Pseudonocardia cypriaca]